MEQLVIILIIGAVSLIKWLMEKSAEARAKADTAARMDETESSPRPRPIATPWDAPRPIASPLPKSPANDAARRLREALGLPPESPLPSCDPRPSQTPPTPTLVVEKKKARPLAEIAADLERRVVAETKVLPPRSFVAPAPAVLSSPVVEPARTTLNDLLRSREGLRKAILAQEILGTPKGLVF